MPKPALGGHWGEGAQLIPGEPQTAFSWDAHEKMVATQRSLIALFAAMARKAGGLDWLAAALNKEPGYAKKIGGAINGEPDRKVQLEWFAPLLDDPNATDILLGWLSERCGYEPPVRLRVVEKEDIGDAAIEVIAEIKDDEQRELFRERIAKKLGVRPDRVRL